IFIDDQRYIKGGLHCRLIKGWKGPAGVRRFKLRGCVVSQPCFGQIEAPQFVIQYSSELNLDGGWPRGQRVREGESCLLFGRIKSDFSILGIAALSYSGLLKLDLSRIQGDGISRTNYPHIDGFLAGKRRTSQIRRKG